MSNSFQLCLLIVVNKFYPSGTMLLFTVWFHKGLAGCRALIGHLFNPRAVYLFGSLDSVKAKNKEISCTERTSFFDR